LLLLLLLLLFCCSSLLRIPVLTRLRRPDNINTSDAASNYEARGALPHKATNREPRPHAADERLQLLVQRC
jgi:hypothetical protein